MRSCETNKVETNAARQLWSGSRQSSFKPSHLHLVTEYDLQDLSDALARGHIPPDLEAKLIKLANGNLVLQGIEKNCRTVIALLQANHENSFREASREEHERLLRVLAYIRKDDDAISDYRQDGFMDDQQEMREAATDLGSLLQAFKAWRLRHQVPAMWERRPM